MPGTIFYTDTIISLVYGSGCGARSLSPGPRHLHRLAFCRRGCSGGDHARMLGVARSDCQCRRIPASCHCPFRSETDWTHLRGVLEMADVALAAGSGRSCGLLRCRGLAAHRLAMARLVGVTSGHHHACARAPGGEEIGAAAIKLTVDDLREIDKGITIHGALATWKSGSAAQ
jgi:hypothetical protein